VTLLCTPGSATTECATPTARRACASDGMSYVATACASGQSCNAGVCAVRCGDGIVGSGETCDDGNTVSGDGCSAVCGLESARSCREKLMVSPGSPSGVYTIDPDGTGPTAPLSVYCDMTSDGGGWTMVVAQFEAFPETNWNRGTTSTYDPTLASGRGFALSTSQIPTHTQTAFGKGTAATFVDYTDYSYSTGNLSATSLRGIRTGVMFQVHRNSASYYYGHDPESMLVASCRDPFCNTLTFDRMGGLLYSWAFSPDRSTPTERGFAMMGDWRSRSDSFAWTVWVR
jgi:cysteine-rich repeat protein